MIDRRRFTRTASGGVLASLATGTARTLGAQDGDGPDGRIAFVKNGDIFAWSSSDGVLKIVEDGAAMDPTWDPGTNFLLYARDGGSYANLILANASTGRKRRLTDNESTLTPGSAEYVANSVWAIDPSWSASGIVCYASNQETAYAQMQLWILDPTAETTYMAAWDGMESGSLEHISVDGEGVYAVYTVLDGEWGAGSTYVSLRDLATGATYPLIEGPQGAYDPAISRDGQWVVASLRDEDGTSDLWLCNRLDESLSRLTRGEQASNAAWSADGRWVAYLSMEGSGFALKAIRVDLDEREAAGNPRTLVDTDRIDSTCGLSWNER